MGGQATSLRPMRSLPCPGLCITRPVGTATTVAVDLPAHARGGSPELGGDHSNRHAHRDAAGDLLALFEPKGNCWPSSRPGSDASIQCQDAIDPALVPALEPAGNIRHALPLAPPLPQLRLLLGAKPRTRDRLHIPPPNLRRLEGVASIGRTRRDIQAQLRVTGCSRSEKSARVRSSHALP